MRVTAKQCQIINGNVLPVAVVLLDRTGVACIEVVIISVRI